jgi:hypothetical protein
MATVPANADTHALFPIRHLRPNGVNDAHHFVARDARILYAWKYPGDGEHVTMADAAGLHFDAHLAWFGVGYISLDDFKFRVGLGNLNDLHAAHCDFLSRFSFNDNT